MPQGTYCGSTLKQKCGGGDGQEENKPKAVLPESRVLIKVREASKVGTGAARFSGAPVFLANVSGSPYRMLLLCGGLGKRNAESQGGDYMGVALKDCLRKAGSLQLGDDRE